MSSETIALSTVGRDARPIGERLHDWIVTVDHKRLGIMYILYALFFFVVGGVEALVMRIQLIVPHNHFVSPEVFNRMMTMHGTTMIFFMVVPILFWFGTYQVPFMIGAGGMGFTARGLLPTLDGGPMHHLLRAHSRSGTAPISGLLPCWRRVSAVSEQESTSLRQSSACAAPA